MSETQLLRDILQRSSAAGQRLFRNQVGKYQLMDGRWLSSGLCVGSADLIGWTPIVIDASMVGRTVAIFTAVETKAPRGRVSSEQARFIAAVQAQGGIGVVARAPEDVTRALEEFKRACVDGRP